MQGQTEGKGSRFVTIRSLVSKENKRVGEVAPRGPAGEKEKGGKTARMNILKPLPSYVASTGPTAVRRDTVRDVFLNEALRRESEGERRTQTRK